MRPWFLVLAVLLAGCIDGPDCDLEPRDVQWEEPGFDLALREADPAWTVRVVAPPPGFPSADPTLASWNATVQSIWSRGGESDIRLKADGTLSVGWMDFPQRPMRHLHDEVTAALAERTDGNDTELRNWVDALLAEPAEVHSPDDTDAVRFLEFRTRLPVERVRVDDLLADHVPDRTSRFRAGDWSLTLAFPAVEATRGTQTFTADVEGDNVFTDTSWSGMDNEGAYASFAEAHESLGLGAAPDQVAFGIC